MIQLYFRLDFVAFRLIDRKQLSFVRLLEPVELELVFVLDKSRVVSKTSDGDIKFACLLGISLRLGLLSPQNAIESFNLLIRYHSFVLKFCYSFSQIVDLVDVFIDLKLRTIFFIQLVLGCFVHQFVSLLPVFFGVVDLVA